MHFFIKMEHRVWKINSFTLTCLAHLFISLVIISVGSERQISISPTFNNQVQPNSVRYSVARLSSDVYTCEDLTRSLLQEFSSHGPSFAHFTTFIDSISGVLSYDADKKAAAALSLVDPLKEDELSHDLWVALFYGCKLGSPTDTVIQRLFRFGLIQSIRTLQYKGIYSIAHYLYPKDSNGDNLMHLAVRSGNPELITLLGDIIHEYSYHLLTGPLSRNQALQTPRDLAISLKQFGALEAIQNLYNAYSNFKIPLIPSPPTPPDISDINLIYSTPTKSQLTHQTTVETTGQHPKAPTPQLVQHDLSYVYPYRSF